MRSTINDWVAFVVNKLTRSRVGLNAVSNIGGKLWSAFLSLLSVPIFLKYLGAEAYGLVGLYASFEVVFNFLDLGLSATMNREIARNIATNKPGGESKNLLRTFEYFYWAIGFVAAILIASLAGWIANNWVIIHDLSHQQVQLSINVMAIVFAARWPMTLYTGVLRGLQKQFLQNVIFITLATLRIFVAFMILKYISRDVTIFLAWEAISCGIEILALLIFAWRELNKISTEKPRADLNLVKGIWKFALSFNVVGVLGMILSQADRLIASKFVNLGNIGYYSVANTAAGSLTMIAFSIGMAVSPKFAADIARNDIQAVSTEFHRYIRLIHYFVFGFGFILILFSSNILYLWTGDWNVVNHTSLILIFLAGASFFNSIANTSYSLLVASGNTRIPLICNIVNFIIFIPTLIFLIPKYGILTVAIVFFLENLISYFVYILSVGKLILKESYFEYVKNDIIPYLISGVVWFLGGKIMWMFWDNESVKLAIIIIVSVGYFVSMAFRLTRDISVNRNDNIE